MLDTRIHVGSSSHDVTAFKADLRLREVRCHSRARAHIYNALAIVYVFGYKDRQMYRLGSRKGGDVVGNIIHDPARSLKYLAV